MKYDKCEYCWGRVKEQKIRVDHRWKEKLVVVSNTPVGACPRCGERYYSETVMHQLDLIAMEEVGSVRRLIVPLLDFSRVIAA